MAGVRGRVQVNGVTFTTVEVQDAFTAQKLRERLLSGNAPQTVSVIVQGSGRQEQSVDIAFQPAQLWGVMAWVEPDTGPQIF